MYYVWCQLSLAPDTTAELLATFGKSLMLIIFKSNFVGCGTAIFSLTFGANRFTVTEIYSIIVGITRAPIITSFIEFTGKQNTPGPQLGEPRFS